MAVDWTPVVDISRNQGTVSFTTMRAQGVKGLILRVSHGQTVDPLFEHYWQGALAAGYAPDDLCCYTFINPKRGTGPQCAAATLTEIQRVTGRLDIGYMIDVENYRDQSPNIGQAPVYGPAFADHIRQHIATVSTTPARLFAYSNRAYWNGKAAGTTSEWVGDDALAGELEWIVARYPAYSDAAYAHYGYPGSPDTWSTWAFTAQPQGPISPRGAGQWQAWQFSAGFNRQGPVYGCSSSDLDLNIVHPEAWARWTSVVTPPPIGVDDMLRLLAPLDSPARFYATCTPEGAALRCEWTGDGTQQKVLDRLAFYRNAHPAGTVPFEMALSVKDLINVSLDGPLPPGFTAAQFANTGEIIARNTVGTVDQVARDLAGIVANDLKAVKTGLVKAGA